MEEKEEEAEEEEVEEEGEKENEGVITLYFLGTSSRRQRYCTVKCNKHPTGLFTLQPKFH